MTNGASPAATKTVPASPGGNGLRVLRLGLLGCGVVGQAVLRVLELTADAFRAKGVKLAVNGVLVRRRERPRNAPIDSDVLLDDPAEFFARDFDIAIEALGGIEPAATYVSRLLERGIPVVTANKSLMAAHGEALRGLARQAGVTLRYEASVIAGVPFLGPLLARPLLAQVERVAGIFNGTSNYILSAMQTGGRSLDEALDEAQRRGYAEPNPTNDLHGVDASEKLIVLLQVLGAAGVDRTSLETIGIEDVHLCDLEQAPKLGGRIKPIVYAYLTLDGPEAYVGPALVPDDHPLAHIDGETNAVQLKTRIGGELLFSGPGAGPEVTAATILDDLVEVVCAGAAADRRAVRRVPDESAVCSAPVTPWYLRLEFTHDMPAAEDLCSFFGAHHIWFRQTSQTQDDDNLTRWHVLTHPCSRLRLELALSALRRASGCRTFHIRGLET